MGSKRFSSLIAFATCLGVSAPALAYNVVQDEPLVVPENAPNDALDPNIIAQSNTGSVTFAGAENVTAGYLQATAAGAITFSGITSASGTISATSTANGVIMANAALGAGGAIVLAAGTGNVTVGDLAFGAPSSITGGQLVMTGALSVPSSTVAAPLTLTAAVGTSATVTINLGATAAVLAAGTHLHVFAWSGPAAHAVTATLGTAPALGAGLKYSLADLAVGGDIIVIAACGDHVVDPGEACDDGNLAPNDGCSATCTIEPPVVDAGPDAGDAGDAGDGGDGGRDAGDAGEPVADADAAVDDGAVPTGSATASAPPALGDIFGDDGSSCAFAPGVLAAPLPAGAALVAFVALLRRRRRAARRE